ncbi:uncharacterized protein LOC112692250 [Sipha flava]|uniref:Uncharacterized protein LOC112692250 n=1 Tax=Sipha flava TaxID=143950 RepID=A0A8B8GI10_9HEMI|nr:uncharacterized protein LOC112692250 [Sipha flava]
MDVLLVGRNPDKLRTVAALIRKESSGCERRVMTVVADFAEDPVARRGERCCGAADEKQQKHDSRERSDAEQQDDGRERSDAERQEDDDRGRSDPEQWQDDVGDQCFCDDHGGRPSVTVRGGGCTRWYPRLRAVIEGRLQTAGGVGVLINCAGVCYPHPEYFASMRGHRDGGGGGGGVHDADFTAEFCDNADASVRCNVAAAVHACRLVLPGMLARGHGIVVNVGSASASIPPATPLMALYAATKKFLEKLSADLDAECVYLCRTSDDENRGALGVRVQCARPAYVATAMLRSANPNVRVVVDGAECGDDDEEEWADDDDDDDYGDRCWWTARRQRLENSVQRWLVPSARRWVRSALRQGGRLYATGYSSAGSPASFTGYWPHTLLVWCATVASAVIPRRWFVDGVLMPGMLAYRAKGRAAAERK